MNSWLFRGVAMSVVHIVARVLLALGVVNSPLQSTTWKGLAVAAVIFIALVWGGIDGIRDARTHGDPDYYEDLTVKWLKAGVFTGVVSAIVCWCLGTWVMAGIGQATFFVELIAGGSFTTLIVFVPAFIGVAVGRAIIRRDQNKNRDDDWSAREEPTVERVGAD